VKGKYLIPHVKSYWIMKCSSRYEHNTSKEHGIKYWPDSLAIINIFTPESCMDGSIFINSLPLEYCT
jgi:hypothetical protein